MSKKSHSLPVIYAIIYLSVQRTAECSFGSNGESSLCKFQVDISKQIIWKAIQGRGRAGNVQRPDYDHTTMDGKQFVQ